MRFIVYLFAILLIFGCSDDDGEEKLIKESVKLGITNLNNEFIQEKNELIVQHSLSIRDLNKYLFGRAAYTIRESFDITSETAKCDSVLLEIRTIDLTKNEYVSDNYFSSTKMTFYKKDETRDNGVVYFYSRYFSKELNDFVGKPTFLIYEPMYDEIKDEYEKGDYLFNILGIPKSLKVFF